MKTHSQPDATPHARAWRAGPAAPAGRAIASRAGACKNGVDGMRAPPVGAGPASALESPAASRAGQATEVQTPGQGPARLAPPGSQRGAVTLLVALTLPLLLGAAALVIDLAWLRVVRAELQNAADAAALAGAQPLTTALPSAAQWTQAEEQARQAVTLNRAAGAPLQTGEVQTGYWNPWQSGAALQPLPHSPGAQEVPAVRVTVRRATGHNGGPVDTFLARLWDQAAVPLGASATAARVSPGTLQPGGVFPLAVSQCLYAQFWDSSANPPGPRLDPATGAPYIFQMGSAYHFGGCDSAQWSSLQGGGNSASEVRDMIRSGNLQPLSVGDAIWVQSGTETTLYNAVKACSEAGNRSCALRVVPVLDTVVAGSTGRIQGFACLRLIDAQNGQKYVLAQMSRSCPPVSGGGIGNDYGVRLPPRLMQ